MEDNTGWTPQPKDNLLGLTDNTLINEYEAKGIARAELFIFELEINTIITVSLILKIHKIAFGELYDWAGRWRNTSVAVGQIEPPLPHRIPNLVSQFVENLNFKSVNAQTREEHIDCLIYAHYEFILIHPFNDGNGRIGRILMNLIALKFGYQPLKLYYRKGKSRTIYIEAMREADKGNFKQLMDLIGKELVSF